MSFPSNKIFPLVGVSKPPISLKVVVFPQPDGPKRVKNSLSLIYKFISSRTTLSPNLLFILTNLRPLLFFIK